MGSIHRMGNKTEEVSSEGGDRRGVLKEEGQNRETGEWKHRAPGDSVTGCVPNLCVVRRCCCRLECQIQKAFLRHLLRPPVLLARLERAIIECRRLPAGRPKQLKEASKLYGNLPLCGHGQVKQVIAVWVPAVVDAIPLARLGVLEVDKRAALQTQALEGCVE